MDMMVLAVDLTRALLNVATGMIVVFAVLILISFIIGLFKYISVFQNKLEARKTNKDLVASSTDTVLSQIEEKEETVVEYADVTDDLELVAVITAAIAASMGTSTDGFVVRSIRRAGKSRWKNA